VDEEFSFVETEGLPHNKYFAFFSKWHTIISQLFIISFQKKFDAWVFFFSILLLSVVSISNPKIRKWHC
jgi:hypothetical protein